MGHAKLGSTDVLEGAYFWRMPPDGHCPCEVLGTLQWAVQNLGKQTCLEAHLRTIGMVHIWPSPRLTLARRARNVFTAWARATHARWCGLELRRGWDRVEVHRGRHAKARPDHRVRYECSTTQDVLYVRLAPRRHDRSVPMLSMDARPLYPAPTWREDGGLSRGHQPATRSSFFPRVTQKTSIVNR